jgi:hypothetical protein
VSSANARFALQSFRLSLSAAVGVAARWRPLGIRCSFRVLGLSEVPALLVLRSHFAVGHFLGYVVFPRKAALGTFSDQCTLSSSFAFLQSITNVT